MAAASNERDGRLIIHTYITTKAENSDDSETDRKQGLRGQD
jgi:hypothetical protein